MTRYTTSQTYTDGNTQIVALPTNNANAIGISSSARRDSNLALAKIPEGEALAPKLSIEDEDLEVKLRRITEQVPIRVSNTSGSSAGSGSGDFHQYRQMRRREQDRLSRMDADYEKRKEESEFLARREERLRAAEERTAKKRAKRQKKKDKKRQKKGIFETADPQKNVESSESSQEEEPQDRGPRILFQKKR